MSFLTRGNLGLAVSAGRDSVSAVPVYVPPRYPSVHTLLCLVFRSTHPWSDLSLPILISSALLFDKGEVHC